MGSCMAPYLFIELIFSIFCFPLSMAFWVIDEQKNGISAYAAGHNMTVCVSSSKE